MASRSARTAWPPRCGPARRSGARLQLHLPLESLDFEGAEAGCEAITLALRPRLADGKGSGDALRATLAYVALRDSGSTTLAFGASTLNWHARYVIPIDEWSHEAFITSVTYRSSGGDAAAQSARERSIALSKVSTGSRCATTADRSSR